MHFLGGYTQGLELAIARKGGFENIAFRKQRRTKAPIEFKLELQGTRRDLQRSALIRRLGTDIGDVRFIHRFTVDTPGTGIRAEFTVKEESFSIAVSRSQDQHGWREIVNVKAAEHQRIVLEKVEPHPLADALEDIFGLYQSQLFEDATNPQELFINALPIRGVIRPFTEAASGFAVCQLSPVSLRQPGIPTPNPTLSSAGENLPALVTGCCRSIRHVHGTADEEVITGLDAVEVHICTLRRWVCSLRSLALGAFGVLTRCLTYHANVGAVCGLS